MVRDTEEYSQPVVNWSAVVDLSINDKPLSYFNPRFLIQQMFNKNNSLYREGSKTHVYICITIAAFHVFILSFAES